MDPFLPDENMIVFLGTNRNSRKVQEIRNNPYVTLYYTDNSGIGYVTISGTAILIDDSKEKVARWKKEWEKFYKDQKESYILVKVIPEELELLNYKFGVIGDAKTWKVPTIEFKMHHR